MKAPSPMVGASPRKRISFRYRARAKHQGSTLVTVAGMDNAIAVVSDTHRTLTMRRVLPQKVDYLYFDLSEVCRPDSYGEVQVDVMTRQVDVAVMADIFAGQ